MDCLQNRVRESFGDLVLCNLDSLDLGCALIDSIGQLSSIKCALVLQLKKDKLEISACSL
jgi:hypothetical protein